eukprot:1780694-Prymnesium_polylepis.1
MPEEYISSVPKRLWRCPHWVLARSVTKHNVGDGPTVTKCGGPVCGPVCGCIQLHGLCRRASVQPVQRLSEQRVQHQHVSVDGARCPYLEDDKQPDQPRRWLGVPS